jgi:hypothetical protein
MNDKLVVPYFVLKHMSVKQLKDLLSDPRNNQTREINDILKDKQKLASV